MTAVATPSVRPATAENPDRRAAELLAALLVEAREPTAVERFARLHDAGAEPAQARYYRDLIPVGLPGAGQQYAFEVDLDVCTGCKACVSACHHLNGLEPQETWRAVGQLQGVTATQHGALPVIQHVTTACHHCVEPGCLAGCPTNAYEKDPVTGIVRHLDDQCFGCQYCTMTCPYEVPQYSAAKGIVRKCDMCHGRLAAGEAPACVQACPTMAIRIAVVDIAETVARCAKQELVADAPCSTLTQPTTVYRSARLAGANLEGADARHAEPQHAHWPLVAMLVLTQGAVGATAIGAAARWFGAGDWSGATILLGVLAGQAGLAVAPLHLGRPHLAYRAVLGWRHSWLSREAILFGVFAAFSLLAGAYAARPLMPSAVAGVAAALLPDGARLLAEGLAMLSGAAAVACSAMIYVVTRRAYWRAPSTFAKFTLTSVTIGLAIAVATGATSASPVAMALASALFATLVAKLALDAAVLRHRDPLSEGDLALTARLLRGPLRRIVVSRVACGAVALAGAAFVAAGIGGPTPALFALLALLATLAGEFAERWLFFSAVVPLRMPGRTPTP